MAHAMLLPLSARSGEREGPVAQRREGEVCLSRNTSQASTPTSPATLRFAQRRTLSPRKRAARVPLGVTQQVLVSCANERLK
jgi:hypothetical protein